MNQDLQLNKISFCGKYCYNICNNDIKQKCLDDIKQHCDYSLKTNNIIQYNQEEHYKLVVKNSYLVSAKSIGNSYYLYLTKINGMNNCMLIDKKILAGYELPRILLLRYRFKESLFENGGTLLEGELVKTENDNQWKFILNNILMKSGSKLNIPILKKLQILKTILFHQYVYDPYFESCPLRVKKYFPFDKKHINLCLEYISKLNYKIMSLELTPAYIFGKIILLSSKSNYKLNTQPRIFIQKKSPKHLFANFLMSKTITPGIYQLYCLKNGFISKHSIARIDGLECIQFIKQHFKEESKKLVLCKYDPDFSKFIPIKTSSKNKPDDFREIILITNEKNKT
jgi:hypothetical protein